MALICIKYVYVNETNWRNTCVWARKDEQKWMNETGVHRVSDEDDDDGLLTQILQLVFPYLLFIYDFQSLNIWK